MAAMSKCFLKKAGALNGRPTESGLPLNCGSRLAIQSLQTSPSLMLRPDSNARSSKANRLNDTHRSSGTWNGHRTVDRFASRAKCMGKGNEMAIANVEGSSKGFSVVTSDEVVEDFSWHPDGSRILMAKHAPQYPDSRLFVCDPKTLTITLLESQPMDQKNVSGVWSPSGSQIVFISTPKPKAVPWIQKNARKTSSR